MSWCCYATHTPSFRIKPTWVEGMLALSTGISLLHLVWLALMGKKQSRVLSPKTHGSNEGAGFKHRQHGLRAKGHTSKDSLVAGSEATPITQFRPGDGGGGNMRHADRSVLLPPSSMGRRKG